MARKKKRLEKRKASSATVKRKLREAELSEENAKLLQRHPEIGAGPT